MPIFENAIGRLQAQLFGHQCDNKRLRNRLIVPDRQRAVRVTSSAQIFGDEFFSRHFRHRRQNALVTDPARLELFLDHFLPLGREIGIRRGVFLAAGRRQHRLGLEARELRLILISIRTAVTISPTNSSCPSASSWLISTAFMNEDRKTLEQRAQMTDIERLRHSASHVLATAILKIWPEAQFAAGPPVENGFYYDVDLPHRISPEDFEKIEAEMKKEIKANHPFEKMEVSRDEALDLGKKGRLAALGDRKEPSKFKLDIIENIPAGEKISLYRNGDFIDLCAGPHVMRTGNIGAFKLTSVASAYYKGDEKNPQLQRIYGTAFKTRKELDEYFAMLEEAKKRDHRKLGKELEIYVIDEDVGPGLPLWLPRGAAIIEELEKLAKETEFAAGYQRVRTVTHRPRKFVPKERPHSLLRRLDVSADGIGTIELGILEA